MRCDPHVGCGEEARNPQRHVREELVPYRKNGWIGDNFIPYEKIWKGVKEIKIVLCGLCYAKMQSGVSAGLGTRGRAGDR